MVHNRFRARGYGVVGIAVTESGILLKIHHSTNIDWLKRDLSYKSNKILYSELGASEHDYRWIDQSAFTKPIIVIGNERYSAVNDYTNYILPEIALELTKLNPRLSVISSI